MPLSVLHNRLKAIFLVIFIMLVAQCQTAPQSPHVEQETENKEFTGEPEITFEKDFFDLGSLQSGEIASVYLTFTNTGNSLLVIQDVKTTCGCTATDWSKAPVKPGEKERIEITFDSSGLSGKQVKNITIQTNADERPSVITLTAEIKNAT